MQKKHEFALKFRTVFGTIISYGYLFIEQLRNLAIVPESCGNFRKHSRFSFNKIYALPLIPCKKTSVWDPEPDPDLQDPHVFGPH
jgi:hypothetical protein